MIQDFQDIHKGETVVVIGNGPSLEVTPVMELTSKYVSLGANKIYGLGVIPSYWTCVDADMLHDCVPYVIKNWIGSETSPIMFVPRYINLPGANLLNVTIEQGFSLDPSEKVILGGTVTYVILQLAFYMGAETVLLIGVDHKYPKAGKGQPGGKFIADGEDPDHFKMQDNTPYFTPGKIYNRPELETVRMFTYPLAKMAYEAEGRQIINLTPDTDLDVFEKQNMDKWL